MTDAQWKRRRWQLARRAILETWDGLNIRAFRTFIWMVDWAPRAWSEQRREQCRLRRFSDA